MGYHRNMLINKFKRLKIEFHYNKNKTRANNHIFKHDASNPLLTLRPSTIEGDHSPHYLDYQLDSIEEIDQQQFIGFSDSDSDGTRITPSNRISLSCSAETQANYGGILATKSMGKESNRDSDLRVFSELHSQRISDPNILAIANHQNDHSEDTSPLTTPPVVAHINYVYQPKSRHSNRWTRWFKKSPVGKGAHLQQINGSSSDQQTNHSTQEQQHIEIIAQSTSEDIGSSVAGNPETGSESSISIIQTRNYLPVDPVYHGTEEVSSFCRRYSRHEITPLKLGKEIKHSKEFCECGVCIRKSSKTLEPWKMVMNDVSLYAARLSTAGGSKSNVSLASPVKLTADFTNSKHMNALPISHGTLDENDNLLMDPDKYFDSFISRLKEVSFRNSKESFKNFGYDLNHKASDATQRAAKLVTLIDNTLRSSDYGRKIGERRLESKGSTQSDELEEDAFPALSSAPYKGVVADYNSNSAETLVSNDNNNNPDISPIVEVAPLRL